MGENAKGLLLQNNTFNQKESLKKYEKQKTKNAFFINYGLFSV
ncbi:hypothetical protein ES705_23602 [subsurface metagenome]